MSAYESKRIIFAIIEKKYKEYIALYKLINNGSIEGITPFDEFYWNYTYYSKYSGGKVADTRGY
jgi:hypothetical protein